MAKYKKWIYTICFLLLGIVDWSRHTQLLEVWGILVNATGLLLLAMILPQYSIKELKGPFAYVWSALSAVAIVVVLVRDQSHYWGVYYWAVVVAILNVWWIGIFAWYLFRKIVMKKTQKLHLGPLGWAWIAMGVFLTVNVSGTIWGLWYFAMFSIFYLTTYTEEESRDLLDGMINGTILSFFALQIFAYGFRPYDNVRYQGALNYNFTALHYLVTYAMLLFKLHILELKGAKKGWKLFYLLGAAGLLCFIFLTIGRTSWVVAALITLLYGIFVVRKIWKKKWSQVLLRAVALGMSTLLLFPVVFGTVRWLPTILHHPVWYYWEYSVDKVHSYDPPNSEKYVEMDEFLDAALGRILSMLGFQRAEAEETEELSGVSLQASDQLAVQESADGETMQGTDEMVEGAENAENTDVTTEPKMDKAVWIRFQMYKSFIKDQKFWGCYKDAATFEMNGEIYGAWHTHNLWIQISYYHGILAGILFVVLTFVLLGRYFLRMKRSRQWPYAIIPFFVCVIFYTFGIMEAVWLPGQVIMFLFYFTQHPNFHKVEELPENN